MAVRTSTDSSCPSLEELESSPEASPSTPSHYFLNEHSNASKEYHYKEVHVLMFLWEDDDLQVGSEVRQLKDVFSALYNFRTHISIIPSKNPSQHVSNEISELRHILNSSNKLVIVYYGGHGHLLKYGKLTWSAYQKNKNFYTKIPGLRWSSLQSQLELSPADVLILLDCCESGGSLHSSPASAPTSSTSPFTTSKPGTTELIAASPFDTSAPGPGEGDFTGALIRELKLLAEQGEMFSVVELHRRVLANIIKQRTGLKSKAMWACPYPSVSPVYVRLVGGAEVPSIGLMPLGVETKEVDTASVSSRSMSSRSTICSKDDLPEDFVKAYRARKDAAQAAVEAVDRVGAKYWRMTEYEAKQALKVKKRKKRLEAFGWRQWKKRGSLAGPVELHNESPEVVVWRPGEGRGALWRNAVWLRDLVLRVPKLEACDL